MTHPFSSFWGPSHFNCFSTTAGPIPSTRPSFSPQEHSAGHRIVYFIYFHRSNFSILGSSPGKILIPTRKPCLGWTRGLFFRHHGVSSEVPRVVLKCIACSALFAPSTLSLQIRGARFRLWCIFWSTYFIRTDSSISTGLVAHPRFVFLPHKLTGSFHPPTSLSYS
jgi:hypothetical protein